MHDYRVAFAGERQQCVELRPLCVSAQCLVGEQFVRLDLIELMLWILVETADPNITDALMSTSSEILFRSRLLSRRNFSLQSFKYGVAINTPSCSYTGPRRPIVNDGPVSNLWSF